MENPAQTQTPNVENLKAWGKSVIERELSALTTMNNRRIISFIERAISESWVRNLGVYNCALFGQAVEMIQERLKEVATLKTYHLKFHHAKKVGARYVPVFVDEDGDFHDWTNKTFATCSERGVKKKCKNTQFYIVHIDFSLKKSEELPNSAYLFVSVDTSTEDNPTQFMKKLAAEQQNPNPVGAAPKGKAAKKKFKKQYHKNLKAMNIEN